MIEKKVRVCSNQYYSQKKLESNLSVKKNVVLWNVGICFYFFFISCSELFIKVTNQILVNFEQAYDWPECRH